MMKLSALVLGVCVTALVSLGCGGSSSGEKVVTYQGPAENAPQPKGMAKKGYGRQTGAQDPRDTSAATGDEGE